MKIEFNKKNIESGIQKAVRLTGKHLTLPVLSCLFIDTIDDTQIVIKSTNLDLGIEIKVKGKVFEKGNVCVPASILFSFLSSIKDETVIFEKKEENLIVKTKNNSSIIKCMPSDDFPSIPKIISDNSIKINFNDLMLGFRSVWYSASNSSIKPELGSIYVYKGDRGLVFVSTDSFRLAEKTINTKVPSNFPSILIPYKNAVEIVKIFEEVGGEVDVLFEKNQIAILKDDIYVVSRLIDGNFPDYKQIIPKSYITTAIVLKNDLINSIKTSNIFSDNLNQIKISVNVKNKNIEIQSKNNDVGEYKEEIRATTEGESVELNFNNRYITECMQSIVSDSVLLSFAGVGKPLMINGSTDKNFLYIVMPMNR